MYEVSKFKSASFFSGLLSWDVNSSGCDLSGLEYALSANIKDSVAESGEFINSILVFEVFLFYKEESKLKFKMVFC